MFCFFPVVGSYLQFVIRGKGVETCNGSHLTNQVLRWHSHTVPALIPPPLPLSSGVQSISAFFSVSGGLYCACVLVLCIPVSRANSHGKAFFSFSFFS